MTTCAMSTDTFGDLEDYGPILERLAGLKGTKEIGECQDGLVRLLRYRANWRLREAALDAVRSLSAPSDEVIAEVLGILRDRTLYDGIRILAASVLLDLVQTLRASPGSGSMERSSKALREMSAVLALPETPVLQEAVRKSLALAEAPSGPGGQPCERA